MCLVGFVSRDVLDLSNGLFVDLTLARILGQLQRSSLLQTLNSKVCPYADIFWEDAKAMVAFDLNPEDSSYATVLCSMDEAIYASSMPCHENQVSVLLSIKTCAPAVVTTNSDNPAAFRICRGFGMLK